MSQTITVKNIWYAYETDNRVDEKQETVTFLIDPKSYEKMEQTEYNNYEACEAHHALHYHADGVVLRQDGSINLEHGVCNVCMECEVDPQEPTV